MNETYFSKVPVITYNNYATRDITERVALVNKKNALPTTFSPFEIADHTRADVLAWKLYNDATLDWMLYLTNNILDPYYEWHLSVDEFEGYIIKKYGSIAYAENKVAYFRLIWPEDAGEVAPDAFLALPEERVKYYQPNLGAKGKIISYSRVKEDWTMSTNKIMQWDVTMSTGTFANGDLIELVSGGAHVGGAEVVTANSTVLKVQHLQNFDGGSTSIRGFSNNSITGTITANTELVSNISDTEASFWEPLYCYDLESELNESRRFIDVIDPGAVMQLSDTIRRELANN